MTSYEGKEKKVKNMTDIERSKRIRVRASPEALKSKHLTNTAYAVQRMKEWAWKVQDLVESDKYPLTDAQREKIDVECQMVLVGIKNSLTPKVKEIVSIQTFTLD